MLDPKKIKAISLDLDDTLWPIWPAIERAEKTLENWLGQHAPATAVLLAKPDIKLAIRREVVSAQPELAHNLSAIRLEMIRVALTRCGDNVALAAPAFEMFYAERNCVSLYSDALLALEFLAARFPVIAVSNGNADIEKIGIHRYFRASISAQQLGVAKPDPRIFHAAAGLVAVCPTTVLHVGDDPEMDVLGALASGMQAVWLNRTAASWAYPQAPHAVVTNLTELCDLLA